VTLRQKLYGRRTDPLVCGFGMCGCCALVGGPLRCREWLAVLWLAAVDCGAVAGMLVLFLFLACRSVL
jgi:hypothetical protein